MAVVTHKYQGRVQSDEEKRQRQAKQKLDSKFVAAKTEQVNVRRMQTELELARRRGELIETDLAVK
jgi:hypothetical protein